MSDRSPTDYKALFEREKRERERERERGERELVEADLLRERERTQKTTFSGRCKQHGLLGCVLSAPGLSIA